MKYILIIIFIVIALALISISAALMIIRYYGKKYILGSRPIESDYDAVIVLGAGIRPDGNPCDLLADRIKTGTESYLSNKCSFILLTGEDRDESYNEVLTMKRWIKKNYEHIDNDQIKLDGLGLCTYDSMYRAKYFFNINTAIIVTNQYHLPRAIYLARGFGIKAYGVKSDLRQYDRMKKYKRREILAQVKDFYLINLFRIKNIFRR